MVRIIVGTLVEVALGRRNAADMPSLLSSRDKPLIDPYELGMIEFGTGIIKLLRTNPIKVKYCQFHKTPQFAKELTSEKAVISKSLNVDKVFYDIDKRNSVVFSRRPN